MGREQLRADAVGLKALGFPLGAVAVTDRKVEDLTKNGCNGGGFSGKVVPDCTPPRLGGPTPGREVRIHVRLPGRLLVSAIVGLKNEGAPQTTADIKLSLNVDDRSVAVSQMNSFGGQIVQVPIQTLVDVSAGWHTAGVEVSAEYDSSTPGDVLVSEASVIASAFPGADVNETKSGRT